MPSVQIQFARFHIPPEPRGLEYEPAFDTWATAHWGELVKAAGYKKEDKPAVYRLTRAWRGFRKGSLLVKPAYDYTLSFAIETGQTLVREVTQYILPGIESGGMW